MEEEYFVQLFFEIDPEKHVLPFTEVLLWKMFKERNISFAEVNGTCWHKPHACMVLELVLI